MLREQDPVASIKDLTGGNGADIVFECAGGSPKQGLAGVKSLTQAIDAVRSGGVIVGVSWFGAPVSLPVDLLRERSIRYVFPDISTLQHLEHTVRLVSSGRVRLKPAITHVLKGSTRSRKHSRSPPIKGSTRRSIPLRSYYAIDKDSNRLSECWYGCSIRRHG